MLVNTNLCHMNTLRLTSSKQFSPEVVKVLRREATLGVRVEVKVHTHSLPHLGHFYLETDKEPITESLKWLVRYLRNNGVLLTL